MTTIRVLVVDDHNVVRQGLCFLLSQQPDIDVIGEAADGQEAIEQSRELQPAVVLLDLLMPNIDGLGALRGIKQASPASAVIVLTSHVGDEHIVDALRGGAVSYLLKTAGSDEVVESVRAAARGDSILNPMVAGRLLQELREPARGVDQLTPRERDVLLQIARGRTNRDIARNLYIGEETVKTHVSSILAKLHLTDRTQAAIYALRHRLIPLDQD